MIGPTPLISTPPAPRDDAGKCTAGRLIELHHSVVDDVHLANYFQFVPISDAVQFRDIVPVAVWVLVPENVTCPPPLICTLPPVPDILPE